MQALVLDIHLCWTHFGRNAHMRRRVGHIALAKALRAAPIRWAVLLVGETMHLVSRFASAARTSALFPQSEDCFCHWSAEVKYPDRITLGQGVIIGPHCTIGAASPIRLGKHVHLSKGVYVETGGLDFSAALPYPHVQKPITIGDGVWIGVDAIVLGGVTIGDRAVIGAGAVVSRDVPPDTIVTGQPTRHRSRLRTPEQHLGAIRPR